MQKMHPLAENAATLLIELSPVGEITFANEAFWMITKYKTGELIGQDCAIINHPDMPDQLLRTVWETISEGKIFRGVIKFKAKDDSAFWASVTILPVQEGGKGIGKHIEILQTICDSKVAGERFEKQMLSFYLDLK
ncbi:MAG: PAS domain-containing protein [Bacteroidetes bacterium]|nr:PAS domain-containing protein [Bacteroidota bacterium]